jgi:hypothetical protein
MSSVPSWAGDEVIREELFSVERLEQHAESLAAAQSVSSQPETGRPLTKRVRDNDEALLEAYRVIAAAIKDKRPITPAAEWLIDNFHVAEDQIREIRTDLPSSYYRQLPKLAEGPFEGYPRIFEVAWAFVAHTDSRFEAEMLRRFVEAYQRVQRLTIGELWDRRDLVWINVTTNPTAEWIARQLTEAFPWNEAPRYLIRDRDRIYGAVVMRRMRAMGIRDKPTAPASPWQNGFAERLIGSIRRECVDHFIVLGEAHLRRILRAYAGYYNDIRTHWSLDKDAPVSRPIQPIGSIKSHSILGGLHHHYVRV